MFKRVARTITHINLTRFCADCKHNVVIAFDLLTQRYDASGIDNNTDEYNPELFKPFEGRMRPSPEGCDLGAGQCLLDYICIYMCVYIYITYMHMDTHVYAYVSMPEVWCGLHVPPTTHAPQICVNEQVRADHQTSDAADVITSD